MIESLSDIRRAGQGAFGAIELTRAQINASAGTASLISGQSYLITDENRFAVGTSTTTYQAHAKEGEGGGGGGGSPILSWVI